MKGRWAAGIVPRNFAWILKGQLAVSERPGGYAPHHRRVRRHEELLWLRGQGFTRIVSLLGSSHNLHAYEEHNLPSSHFPLPAQGDLRPTLASCYPAILGWLRDGERILLHHEELGDRVAGVAAGFVCWSGLLPDAPQAITAVEHLLKRQLGSLGRGIVAAAAEIAPEPGARAFRPPASPDASVQPIGRHGAPPAPVGAPARTAIRSAAPHAGATAHPPGDAAPGDAAASDAGSPAPAPSASPRRRSRRPTAAPPAPAPAGSETPSAAREEDVPVPAGRSRRRTSPAEESSPPPAPSTRRRTPPAKAVEAAPGAAPAAGGTAAKKAASGRSRARTQ